MTALALVLLLQDDPRDALDRRITLSVREVSLDSFAILAGSAAHVTLDVDPRVGDVEPIDATARDLALRTVLRDVLVPRGLTVVWRHDRLVIVPREGTRRLETRTYDVAGIRAVVQRMIETPASRWLTHEDPDVDAQPPTPAYITIELPEIAGFWSRQTILVPVGGSVLAAGSGGGESAGASGSGPGGVSGGGATGGGVCMDVEIVDLDPDHYYGTDEPDSRAPPRDAPSPATPGESFRIEGDTLIATTTSEGHARLERVLDGLRHDR